MPREYKKKEWIIKCGGAEAYLTKIETPKGQNTVYTYGTSDKRKAKRFTEEDAKRIAEERQAEMIKVNYKGGNEDDNI